MACVVGRADWEEDKGRSEEWDFTFLKGTCEGREWRARIHGKDCRSISVVEKAHWEIIVTRKSILR